MIPTERLYYADAYLCTFGAQVVAQQKLTAGLAVALDRSAFYPEGGGQPCDYGWLNACKVIDVQVDDQGMVWHTLATAINATHVRGEIDWPRRFDHMQQHHGQHLLSAACEQLHGFRTIAFHLGTETVTIDLDTPALTQEQAQAAEALANRVIWEDRPIQARFVSQEELASISLRKPPSVQGPIRVVSVPDFDNSACGGTHPRATGGVGLLHIRRWERRGNATRVEFVCGQRAHADLRAKHALLSRMASSMSVGVFELEAALARLRESDEKSRTELNNTREQLLGYQAQVLVASARQVGDLRVVSLVSETYSIEQARLLMRMLTEQGCLAIIGLMGDKGHLLIARAHGQAIDCGQLVRAALTSLGGKGGGRPEAAQGGLPDASRIAEAVELAVQAVRIELL